MSAGKRIIVFAYHDVGYECLEVLLQQKQANVVALFTHQDNPKEHIWFKSVAELAKKHNIPVFTPENPNLPEIIQQITALKPDVIFSFYYRHMICEQILQLPKLGAFNMHGSLLPSYRGRVPINWAIIHGETQSGATLHYMVKRADAGDIVDQEAVTIEPLDTAQIVFHKVTHAAHEVLERQLNNILNGTAPRIPQDETKASYFSGRKPEDGRIEWNNSSQSIFNLIRAVTNPYPGAFTEINGKKLIVWWAKPRTDLKGIPGTVIHLNPLTIATQDGSLEILDWEWEQKIAPQEHLPEIQLLEICQ